MKNTFVLAVAFTFIPAISTNSYANSDFWISTGGPVGGEITNTVGFRDSIIYAVDGQNRAMYRSVDAGFFWTRVASFDFEISALIALNDGSIIAGGGGISRSTDEGETWSSADLGAGANQVYAFAVDSPNLLYASTSRGILFSTDYGIHWNNIAGPDGIISSPHLAVSRSHILFALAAAQIFFTTDSGKTWGSIPYPSNGPGVNSFIFDSQDRPLCGLNWTGFFRYESSSQKWKKISTLLTFNASLTKDLFGVLYLGADGGLFRSTDDGVTWELCGLGNSPIVSVYAGSLDVVVAGVELKGLAVSHDGSNSWSYPKITSTNILSLAFSGMNQIACEENLGVLFSTDAGGSWNTSNLSGYGVSSLLEVNDKLSFATKGYFGAFRSSDGGANWTNLGPANVMGATALMAKKDGTIYVGGYNNLSSLFRSTNNGDVWEQTEFSIANNANINALSITPDGSVLVGTQLWGIYRSTNGVDNWQQSGLAFQWVTSFAVSPSGSVFAGSHSGINRSTDNGKTWLTLLSGRDVRSLAVDSSDNIFAGIYPADVIESTDNGFTWKETGTGLKGRFIQCLTVTPDGYVYAGTDDGIYRSQSKTTSVRQDRSHYPVLFSMAQNYPNPFNPSTTIRYSVPNLSKVRIVISNALGQVIAVLTNGEQETGYHEVKWRANATSGIYFYRIEAVSTMDLNNRFIQVKKMILLK